MPSEMTGETRGFHILASRGRASWRAALRMARRDVRRTRVAALSCSPWRRSPWRSSLRLSVGSDRRRSRRGSHPLGDGRRPSVIQEPQETRSRSRPRRTTGRGRDSSEAGARVRPGPGRRPKAGAQHAGDGATRRRDPIRSRRPTLLVSGGRRVRIHGPLVEGRAADLGAKSGSRRAAGLATRRRSS